jgi:tellurite methyltransferase
MIARPFWEAAYAEGDSPDTFAGGKPSDDVVAAVALLAPGARVLDLGCGDGRNSLYVASRGFDTWAMDVSEAGIEKLRRLADGKGLRVTAAVGDLRDYRIPGPFDLIVAHGCLHLIERDHWRRTLADMQASTKPGGYNVVAVFTDTVPAADDLRDFTVGIFREGELFSYYATWDVISKAATVFDDEHPGGHKHRHAQNAITARKPGLP